MPNIREVAKLSGYSPATVSRTFNGNPRVNPVIRREIESAASRLNYHPRTATRRRRQGLVGLLVPSIEQSNFASGVALLEDMLAEEGFQIVLRCHHNDPAREADALRALVSQHVDAILHVPCATGGAVAVLGENERVPIVEFHHRSQSAVEAVVADDHLGCRELTRHLLSLGHERIALFSGDGQHSSATARIAGFRSAVAEASLSADYCPVISGVAGVDWGSEAVRFVLTTFPRTTAFIAASPRVLRNLFIGLNMAGVQIPEEISLAGICEANWCEVTSPPLTTYANPEHEMGLVAANLLLNHLRRSVQGDLKPPVVSLAGELVVRQSTVGPRKTRHLPLGKKLDPLDTEVEALLHVESASQRRGRTDG